MLAWRWNEVRLILQDISENVFESLKTITFIFVGWAVLAYVHDKSALAAYLLILSIVASAIFHGANGYLRRKRRRLVQEMRAKKRYMEKSDAG